MPAQAFAETRSLKLYYVHTGEKAEIAFKRNGRYLPDGLKRLNVFLRDWRRNEPTKMDPRLFDLVWQVYKSSGSSQYITVVSAYRSPATNKMLRGKSSGVAKKSQHMLGRAMDFFIPGVNLAKLRGIGMRYQIGGVGYYPRSGSPFVHMDVGNVRSWPRMSRRELLALFPDGKTAHLPSDGKPLPGYQQALAMIEKRKGSGGEILMASNSSTKRKSKSLFGALFGGGADEEEDNGDTAVRGSARPVRNTAPVREAPAAVPQQPVQPEETMIAALPTRNAPIPMQAPRPETNLESLMPAVEPQNAAPAQDAALVAMNVPIPASKPQDAIALAMAEAETQAPSALMNGFVPVPSIRPDGQSGAASGQDAIAALVSEQHDVLAANNADASAPIAGQAGALPLPQEAPRASTEIAMLSKSDEIGELIATPKYDDDYDTKPVAAVAEQPTPVQVASAANAIPVQPAVTKQVAKVGKAANTGVRTTTKGARKLAKALAKPRPVVQPVTVHNAAIAMSAESVAKTVPETNPNLRNDAMRTAPAVVYTAGFQQGDLPSEQANKFRGNAVTFLTVAKFSKPTDL
ncbi:DUF882 domain-containing protein [Brucella sp. BE17]|uniref:DUF882 domain-containing protein n=1 Tax=Brucella sp. BE17 TaxID=3142977 RepID=UPI0031BBC23F